jgi:hypothetical protein
MAAAPSPARDAAGTSALRVQLFATDAADKAPAGGAPSRRPCTPPCDPQFGGAAAGGSGGGAPYGAAGYQGTPVASPPLDALAISQGGSWSLSQYAWRGEELVRGARRAVRRAARESAQAPAQRAWAGRTTGAKKRKYALPHAPRAREQVVARGR